MYEPSSQYYPSRHIPIWTQSCHVPCNINVIISLKYYVFCVYMRNSINTVVYYVYRKIVL